MKKNNASQLWTKQILKDPKTFESKFVVHTDQTVVFVSAQILEAKAWVKKNQGKFLEELLIFLVPNGFGQVRLRMLKPKKLAG